MSQGWFSTVEIELLQQLRQRFALWVLLLVPLLSVPAGLWGAAPPADQAVAERGVSVSETRAGIAVERHQADALARSLDAVGVSGRERGVLQVRVSHRWPRGERERAVVVRWLPLLICFCMLTVATYTALDMVSGERERSTIETLLVTVAERRTIVVGKTVVATGLTAVAGGMGLLGGVVGGWLGGPHVAADVVVVWGGLVPLLAIQAATGALWIATWVPDYRSGSMWAAPAVLAVLLPLVLTVGGEVELGSWWKVLPLVNLALAGRTWLEGSLPGLGALVCVGIAVLQALGASWFASRRIGNEASWLGAPGGLSTRPFQHVVAWWAVGLVAQWWITPLVDRIDPVWGPGVLEAALLTLMAWFAVRLVGASARGVVGGRVPAGFDMVMAGLAGMFLPCVFAVVAAIQAPWAGVVMPQISPQSGWVAAGVVYVIVPALVRELWFRGVLLGLLRRTHTRWVRVAIVAMLDAISTFDPVRMVPTFVVGVVLGTAVERSRSLWPAALLRGLASSVVLVGWWWGLPVHDPPALVAVSGALLTVGCVLWMGRARYVSRTLG